MFKIASMLILAVSLAACDAVSTVTEGFKNAKPLKAIWSSRQAAGRRSASTGTMDGWCRSP